MKRRARIRAAIDPATRAWLAFIVICSAGIVAILATHATGRAAVGCWDRAAVYNHPAQVCVDSCSPARLRAPNPCPAARERGDR